MSAQKQKSKSKRSDEQSVEATPAPQKQDHITDDLLNHIDSVLEVNAEEFVKAYQQKGGQ